MSVAKKHVLIVGGGLAGLACANRLHAAGAAPFILEASDGVGGRVRTDVVVGTSVAWGVKGCVDACRAVRVL